MSRRSPANWTLKNTRHRALLQCAKGQKSVRPREGESSYQSKDIMSNKRSGYPRRQPVQMRYSCPASVTVLGAELRKIPATDNLYTLSVRILCYRENTFATWLNIPGNCDRILTINMYFGGSDLTLPLKYHFWCERGDLNSHVSWHTPLKRACLPIPALSQIPHPHRGRKGNYNRIERFVNKKNAKTRI